RAEPFGPIGLSHNEPIELRLFGLTALLGRAARFGRYAEGPEPFKQLTTVEPGDALRQKIPIAVEILYRRRWVWQPAVAGFHRRIVDLQRLVCRPFAVDRAHDDVDVD